MVQISLPYITTGKTIALTIETFVGKMMFLLFKMLLRFVSRHLLILWLQNYIIKLNRNVEIMIQSHYYFGIVRGILSTLVDTHMHG